MTTPLTRPVEYAKTSASFRKTYGAANTLLRNHGNFIPLAKYDGVCGIAHLRPGQPSRMISRTGEDYSISCHALLLQLERGVTQFGLHDTELYIMGEVWRPNCPQPTISGDFRQQRRTIEDFEYRIFDLVLLDNHSDQRYYERRLRYREVAARTLSPNIRVAEELAPGYLDADPEVVARGMGPGFDGLVLWNLHGIPLWDKKATAGQAIKFKPNITVDVRCTGGVLGEGKHAGRLGALSYTTLDGKTGFVGTGFSDAERESIWRMLVQLGIDGAIFEVEAMGYTPDGNLREPRFKGFRFDKRVAD
jgi:DNA ligase-1